MKKKNESITCNDCVFKFNELLNNPSPCNCCIRMSEFVPIDEETFNEGFWLDDPLVCNKIMDTIDEVCQKVEALDTILAGKDIESRGSDFIFYLKTIKEMIAETYISAHENCGGGPCYDVSDCPGNSDLCVGCIKKYADPGECPF